MIIDRIFQQARETPGKTAVVSNGVEWNYARFACGFEKCRRRFASENLRAGSLAVLRIENLLDGWFAGLALRHLGLNTIAVGSAEVFGGLGLRDIGCIVTVDPREGAAMANIPGAQGCKSVTLEACDSWTNVDGVVPDPPAQKSPAGGHILMTSGTTGELKKVFRDPVIEADRMRDHAATYGISSASALNAGSFPPWTAGGYRWPLVTWNEGGTVVFEQRDDSTLPYFSGSLTHAFVSPVMLSTLLRSLPESAPRNDGMRLLVTGGALPHALAAEAIGRLTRQVFTVLASTEAAMFGFTRVERPEDLYWHRILPNREVQVVDEAARVLPAGEVGQVRVRCLEGVTGYFEDETATREFFRDGYFYPGDLGAFGPDGRLSLHGRVTDVINVLGNKMPSGPIEQALQDRLAAEGVCVFTMQTAGADEEIHIVIQSRRRIEPAELQSIVAGDLSVFTRAHFHFVENLPRNHMGKIKRRELKQMLQARLQG